MDRAAFLAGVRTALADVQAPPLPAAFPPTPASAPDATPERFLAALRAVSGTADLIDRAGIVEAIVEICGRISDERRSAVIAPDTEPYADQIDAALANAGIEALRPQDGAAWRDDAARAGLGITSARLAVAATGSVLILSGAGSPRAASILPEHHLVILPADRLVASLEDAMPVIAAAAATSSSPFLVTGPSRTSDIEMEMVLGAHGPRSLHVLLVR